GVRLEVLDPSVLGPHGRLVVGDHDDVELAAAGRDGRGDLRAGLVLGEADEPDVDSGVLGPEVVLQGDRVLHLRVRDDGDDDLLPVASDRTGTGAPGEADGEGRGPGGEP